MKKIYKMEFFNSTMIANTLSNLNIEYDSIFWIIVCFGSFSLFGFGLGYSFRKNEFDKLIQTEKTKIKQNFDNKLSDFQYSNDEVQNEQRKKWIITNERNKDLECEIKILSENLFDYQSKNIKLEEDLEKTKNVLKHTQEQLDECLDKQENNEVSEDSEENGIRVTSGSDSEYSNEEYSLDSSSDEELNEEKSDVFATVETYDSKKSEDDTIYIVKYKKSIILTGLKTKEIRENIKSLKPKFNYNRNLTDNKKQKFCGWRCPEENFKKNEIIHFLKKKKIDYVFMKRD